jgi:hypothetical protein
LQSKALLKCKQRQATMHSSGDLNTVNIQKLDRSGFRMGFFLSGCRMVRYLNAIRNLDRFVMNKIFFMTLFFLKRSRLVDPFVQFSNAILLPNHSKTGQFVWFLSSFQMQNGRQSSQKPDSKSVRKMTICNPDGPDFRC